tara:strand:- start:160 stop:471 length:312 start_codon:yes stop_codon:yes gene_type:complete
MYTYEQLSLFEEYEPEVNDYVIWYRNGIPTDQGWVYFKGPKTEPKKGFSEHPRYITIETGIKPKPVCKYTKDDLHKYIHTLLLCYESEWHNLKFVKRRKHRKE